MTAALRLPDAFTPGRTDVAAATPTCCCCCCCCAISVVSASVTLVSGHNQDLRTQQQPPKSPNRGITAAALLAIVPWLMALVTINNVEWLMTHDAWVPLAIAAGAALLVFMISAFGGSRTPWRAPVRLAVCVIGAAVEFFAVMVCLIGLVASGGGVFAAVIPLAAFAAYLGLLFWAPMNIRSFYRQEGS